MAATKERILMAACKIGRNILENGGEIYRVEDSVNFFLQAYGINDAQIFAIPSSVMVTIFDDEKPLTQIERVKASSQNLDKLAKFNNLCRYACKNKPSIQYILDEIDRIRGEKPYTFRTLLLCYGVAAAFFCLFWQGNLRDASVAFVCGLATKYCLSFLAKGRANVFFTNAVTGAVIGYIAMGFVYFGFADNYDKIIIGSIMALVPGVALTNVMRDIIAGDIITGTSKLSEVLLVATAIAVGIAIAMYSVVLFGGELV